MPVDPTQASERFLRYAALERGLSQNSLDAYRRDLDAYAAWLAQRGIAGLDEVGPAVLSEYVAELGGSLTGAPLLAPESINRRMSTVRNLHRYLFDEGLLETNAGSSLRTPKRAQRLPKALPLEDIEAMIATASGDDPVALRDRALLELLYASGARVSEITALDVDDLIAAPEQGDAWQNPEEALGEGGFIRVTGKGSKQRFVPYGGFAGRALAAYLVRSRPGMVEKGKGTPGLFVGPRGARMSRQSVWLVIKAAAERAEIAAEVSPHTFRHSFATHLLAGGADVRSVQELLGHSSVTTTQIYTQVTADTLREHYLTAHPRAR